MQSRAFSSIFKEHQSRVQACWQNSLGIQACQGMVEELLLALEDPGYEDRRANEAGEVDPWDTAGLLPASSCLAWPCISPCFLTMDTSLLQLCLRMVAWA